MSEAYQRLQKQNYRIFIPSRERSELITKRMGVWKHITPTSNYPVTVAVRASECDTYVRAFMEAGYLNDRITVLTVPDNTGIAQKRQLLLNSVSVHHAIIMDDDIVLSYRDETLSSKYRAKEEDFKKFDAFNKLLLESVLLCGEEFPLVGLPLKQGSVGLKYMFIKNAPVIRFACLYMPAIIKEGTTYDGLNPYAMEDRYFQLSLLEKGYSSLNNARYAVDDNGTGFRGGCTATRTTEVQRQAAEQLQQRFPECVTLKIKDNGLWGVPRVDCSINWKHYLKEGELTYLPMEEGLRRISL